MDKETQEKILANIEDSLITEFKLNVIIGSRSNLSNVSNTSSGSLRFHKKFDLIISIPHDIEVAYNWNEVKCCLCNRIITYPTWYHRIKYDINQFHYFVCFDSSSPNKPSTKCYRRIG